MAGQSRIEWTQVTWNPVVGCTKVSSGCANCYAERMAKRLAAMAEAADASGRNAGRTRNYLTVINDRGRWNGSVFLDWSLIEEPFHWSSGRTVFVNSMSDLFHENVPLEFVRRVFDTMNECPRHTFQVLTKRPERAAAWSQYLNWTPNVWLGTSVESQAVTNRIDQLRRMGALVKFLSVEPLLGPIPRLSISGIDWVIVGGESGPGARPMPADWVTPIRDRCVERGVPFFFKQWGGPNKKRTGRELEGRTWDELPPRGSLDATPCGVGVF